MEISPHRPPRKVPGLPPPDGSDPDEPGRLENDVPRKIPCSTGMRLDEAIPVWEERLYKIEWISRPPSQSTVRALIPDTRQYWDFVFAEIPSTAGRGHAVPVLSPEGEGPEWEIHLPPKESKQADAPDCRAAASALLHTLERRNFPTTGLLSLSDFTQVK